jgi:hypothetical protein
MAVTMQRPDEVDEIIRNSLRGVDYGSMATIRTLLDYIEALEVEREKLRGYIEDLEMELPPVILRVIRLRHEQREA